MQAGLNVISVLHTQACNTVRLVEQATFLSFNQICGHQLHSRLLQEMDNHTAPSLSFNVYELNSDSINIHLAIWHM